MSFETILERALEEREPLDENDPLVYPSFNHFGEHIISEKTRALWAGTARPVAWDGCPNRIRIHSSFYYFSNTRPYNILDEANNKLGLDLKMKPVIDDIRRRERPLEDIFEALKQSPVSFIDVFSQFKTNHDHEYADDKLVDFRIDYESFLDMKNVEIIFANSQKTERVLKEIVSRLHLKTRIVLCPLFRRGIENKELVDIIYSELVH